MNVQDFFRKDQIESKPNPGLKFKRWTCAMLFLIFVAGLILITVLYGGDKELIHKYPALIILSSIVCAFGGILFFAMLVYFLEQPRILQHIPVTQLLILKIEDKGFTVKNLKGEEEIIMPNNGYRIDEKAEKAYIELSGMLESPQFTLVLPRSGFL